MSQSFGREELADIDFLGQLLLGLEDLGLKRLVLGPEIGGLCGGELGLVQTAALRRAALAAALAAAAAVSAACMARTPERSLRCLRFFSFF